MRYSYSASAVSRLRKSSSFCLLLLPLHGESLPRKMFKFVLLLLLRLLGGSLLRKTSFFVFASTCSQQVSA